MRTLFLILLVAGTLSAARKVVVTGVLDPNTKTIQVESIAPAP